MRNLAFPLFGLLALGACTAPGGPYPSLQPRSAEAIDPRVPVEKPLNNRPVMATLASELAALVEDARKGDSEFQSAAAQAERLAAAAGAPQGESWVVAQEALSAAVAARGPVGNAVGNVDEVGASALRNQGGIAPNDLAAIKSAAAEIGEIDRREAARIKTIQDRLHL